MKSGTEQSATLLGVERVAQAPAPSWPRWPSLVVIVGALLTATGGLLALFASGEHLNKAGRNYADYFATRDLAIAATLLLVLVFRARRTLVVLMLLTAAIQLLDAVSASLTGRSGLIPVDLAFALAFVVAAARLSGQLRRPVIGLREGPRSLARRSVER